MREGENGVNFFLGDWGGIVASANKAGNALGSADGQPRIVGDDHLDEHVSGEDLFFDGGFFTLVDLDLFLSGDQKFIDVVGQTHGFNFGFESVGGADFMARISVDDIPTSVSGGITFNYDVVDIWGLEGLYFLDWLIHIFVSG